MTLAIRAGWGQILRRVAKTLSTSTPTFVGTPTGSTGVGTRTAVFPAGWAAGDEAVIFHSNAGELETDAPVTPTGWTLVQAATLAGTSAHRLYRRTLQAGDTPPVFTLASGLNIRNGIVCVVVRGGQVEAVTSTTNATSVTTVTAPAVTTTEPKRAVLRFFGEKSSRNTGWVAPTGQPAGAVFTGFLGDQVASGVTSVAVQTQAQEAAGTAAAAAATRSAASTQAVGFTIVLSPRATAEPPGPVAPDPDPLALLVGTSVFPDPSWPTVFDQSQQLFGPMPGVRIFMATGQGMGSWTSGNIAKAMTAPTLKALWVSAKDYNGPALQAFFAAKPDDGRVLYYSYHHEPDGGQGTADFALDPATNKREPWLSRNIDMHARWVAAGSRPDIRLGPCWVRHTLTGKGPSQIGEWLPGTGTPAQVQGVWHFLGWDAYNQQANGYAAPGPFLQIIIDFVRTKGLPWAIGEFGSPLRGPTGSTTQQKHEAFAAWITNYVEVCRNARDCRAVMYWSSIVTDNLGNETYNSRIDVPGYGLEQAALGQEFTRSHREVGSAI